jgi:hypothetical protein
LPSSIGISPLATTHPLMLHGQWVRSSLRLSSKFNLAMARSPGFGSCPCDLLIILPEHKGCAGKINRYGLLTLAFTLTPLRRSLVEPHRTNSLAHSSIGTQSSRIAAGLLLFVSIWFQILFHLPNRDAFHLSLTVLVHYRS